MAVFRRVMRGLVFVRRGSGRPTWQEIQNSTGIRGMKMDETGELVKNQEFVQQAATRLFGKEHAT